MKPIDRICRSASHVAPLAGALGAVALMVSMARAGEVSQTVPYAAVSTNADYNSDDPYTQYSSIFAEETIEGLTKFNPSLGNLREVRIESELNFNYDFGFDSQGILNTSTGSSYYGSFRLDFLGGGIGYSPTAEQSSTFHELDYGVGVTLLSRGGFVGDNSGEVSDGRIESGPRTLSRTLSFETFARADFIRTSASDTELPGFSSTSYVPQSALFVLENLSSGIGAAHNSLDAGTLTLTYVYNFDGDIDGDDEVGFSDLLVLARGYGKPEFQTLAQGDLTGDGLVDFDDLLALARRYGKSANGADVAATSATFAADWARAQSLVPEPGGLLLVAGAAGLLGRRRSRDAIL